LSPIKEATMTRALPHIPPIADERRADAEVVVTFTNRGERALDQLAAVITNRMGRTPHDIADVLAKVYRTPLDELITAFDAIAAEIPATARASTFICGPCREGRHNGCDDRTHNRDYPGCCCQHRPSDPPDGEQSAVRDSARSATAPPPPSLDSAQPSALISAGQIIRWLREMGLTSAEIAPLTGVHPHTVYCWVSGQKNCGMRPYALLTELRNTLADVSRHIPVGQCGLWLHGAHPALGGATPLDALRASQHDRVRTAAALSAVVDDRTAS
jgi:hypothetical protein